MKIDTMSHFNVPNGMTNNDFIRALGDLADLTGDTIYWSSVQLDSGITGFISTGVPEYRAEVALQGKDIEATLTRLGNPDKNDRIVGKVNASYPPELRIRSQLAGKAFTLLKLAEAYCIRE